MTGQSEDEQYLRYLEIGYYAMGAINLLFSLLLTALLVLIIWVRWAPPPGDEAPPWLAWIMMTGIAGSMLLFYLGLAIFSLLAGRWVAARRRRIGCVAAAAVNCVNAGLGTAFGVSAILVLHREGVKRLFQPGMQGTTPLPSSPWVG